MSTPTIDQLLALLQDQQTRIEGLEARLNEPESRPVVDVPAEPDSGQSRMTRRGVLMTAAVGTAGIVGAVLAEPEAARAAAGSHAPESFTSKSNTPAITATNTGKGNAVSAVSKQGTTLHASHTATGSGAVAVRGTIDSTPATGTGVLGSAHDGIGVQGKAVDGKGVVGAASSGTGVLGTTDTGVGVQGTATNGGYGVIGDTDDGHGYGVYGEADDGIGVYGTSAAGTGVEGSSSSGTGMRGATSSGYGVYGSSSSNYGVAGTTTSGNGVYGQVSTASQAGVVGRQLDSSGNWAIYGFGNIGATGTKSAVVPTADGRAHVTLYCMESPECWFEDFGSAHLSGGTASVAIDPDFAQTIETGSYHVFLQANGECKGLSVRSRTETGFVVRELEGGTSNVHFAYRIVALRRAVTAPRLNRIALPDTPLAAH